MCLDFVWYPLLVVAETLFSVLCIFSQVAEPSMRYPRTMYGHPSFYRPSDSYYRFEGITPVFQELESPFISWDNQSSCCGYLLPRACIGLKHGPT